MYTADTGAALLSLPDGEHWDLVVDAIDDVPTKAVLLARCCQTQTRVVSCMGAGGKADVTRLHVSDLRTASRDPLATKLRQHLKKYMADHSDDQKSDYLDNMDKISIVYSTEKPVVKLADFTAEQKEAGVHQFGAVDGMRIRVIPVLGTMPAIMGQALAAMVLTQVGNKPFQPVTGERVGKNVRNKLFQHLQTREDRIQKRVLQNTTRDDVATIATTGGTVVDSVWIGPLQIDRDDVEYLNEIWRNRCGVTNARLGTTLELVRWNNAKPSRCDNLVLMCTAAIQAFDKPGGKEKIPAYVVQRIEERLATCQNDRLAY
jgi:hypothetical protein